MVTARSEQETQQLGGAVVAAAAIRVAPPVNTSMRPEQRPIHTPKTPRRVGSSPRPPDALLTMRRSVYQSSGHSAEDVTWSVVWKSESLTPERQKELLETYGAEPAAPPMPAAPRRKRRENPDL